ncbi:MAG TPA: DeoR/GlpR family DNA-binding transcription regulator, partial [Solirubrobacteraceae bacterium]|nr:DeoR/GlpR family DNA-binding transcription regulator [Solirubrobacteraceae bacterium]
EWLAGELSVAAATIRRDTALLERQGAVARSWGRVGRPGAFVEQPLHARASQHPSEKRRIAERAAKLVHDESLVGLTGGTTTLAVARAIAGRRRLTVVTNSLSIGMQLAPRNNIRLILSGGESRNASFELSGPLSVAAIGAFNLDLAILGVDGIDIRAGCTTYDHAEAATNAALVRQAARSIVVADASKLGRTGFARVCEVSAIETLITDTGASDQQVSAFSAAGVDVIRV